jgi:hypothetical protein
LIVDIALLRKTAAASLRERKVLQAIFELPRQSNLSERKSSAPVPAYQEPRSGRRAGSR